jgi:hypothetical protein
MPTVGLHPLDQDLRTRSIVAHDVAVEEEYDSDTSNAFHSRESTITGSGCAAAEEDAPVYVTAADSFAGMDLKAAMPRRKLRLEKLRDAALAANEPRRPPPSRHPVANDLPLGLILKPHVSRLERERNAALADPLPRPGPRNQASPQTEGMDHSGVDEMLLKQKSQLQKEKEGVAGLEHPPSLPLESLLVKTYSRLQREKLNKSPPSEDLQSSRTNSSSSSCAPRSRLQLELEAAERVFGAGKGQD